MKNFTLKAAIALIFSIASLTALAQTPAPFSGPTDATSAPPASASSSVLCYGSNISLTGPTDGTGTLKYDWYKINSSNTAVLVKEGTNNDNTYTEASAGTGYYTYKLVMVNANGCTSDASDPISIYILPQLSPAIAATNASICEKGQTSTTLSITGLNTNYTYTYQWTREGTDISGATSATYTATEQTAGTVHYGVKVSYTLNSGCSQTATTTINVIAVPSKPTIQIGS